MPVTVTGIVQVVAAGLPMARLPPVKVIVLVAATTVSTLPVPQTLLVVASETLKPAGNTSVKSMPFKAEIVLLLVIVKFSVEVAPSTMLVGLNALVKAGGEMTVRLAVPVPPVPDSAVLTLPVVLVLTPAIELLTLTLIEQELLAGIVPPLKLMAVLPAIGLKVPPQVFIAMGVASTSIPAGKLSVMAVEVSGKAFELVN